MIEVFKTNVTDQANARLLLDALHGHCALYIANFDLEDNDHILRVKSIIGEVDCLDVINIMRNFGFMAEVLPDDVPQLQAELDN
ncbi:hypothetical protein WBG78_17710 [Chryseolinea sp. T2]|uniref:hypothetical protein n=1 Tax=Chryseolinea sp. T2 TaxID=3129255 RepID=UPI003077C873